MFIKVVLFIIVVVDIIAISDAMRSIREPVPKFLWFVCIFFLPLIGAALWFKTQYLDPSEKRRLPGRLRKPSEQEAEKLR